MISGEVFRFIVVGAVNTIITYLIYLFFLSYFSYNFSYTLSFVLGILISYTLNTHFVFKEKWAWKKLIQFPLVYIVQYLASLILLSILIESLSIDARFAPLAVIMLVLPITFVISKWVVKGGKQETVAKSKD